MLSSFLVVILKISNFRLKLPVLLCCCGCPQNYPLKQWGTSPSFICVLVFSTRNGMKSCMIIPKCLPYQNCAFLFLHMFDFTSPWKYVLKTFPLIHLTSQKKRVKLSWVITWLADTEFLFYFLYEQWCDFQLQNKNLDFRDYIHSNTLPRKPEM